MQQQLCTSKCDSSALTVENVLSWMLLESLWSKQNNNRSTHKTLHTKTAGNKATLYFISCVYMWKQVVDELQFEH